MPRRAPADDAAAPRAPSPEAALPAAAPPADAPRSSGRRSGDDEEDSPPAVFNAPSLRAVDADDPFARYLVSLHGEIAARPTMRLDDAGDPAIRAPLTRFHEDDRGAHRGADESWGYRYS
ncbi:hypothetical protein JL722_12068 [Aureococcus anophagefferens]|nr:hypothetical protein JL722_12068 [Aureococcus anophagefferens]